FNFQIGSAQNEELFSRLNAIYNSGTIFYNVDGIDFTSQINGLQKHLVRISKNQNDKIEKSVLEIKSKLSDDKQLRIAVLTKLLRKELDSE
ncbi:MAG: hypothetical protein ACPG44_05930, partial [Polaribacter sp.]